MMTAENVQPLLEPDRDAITAHLGRLFRRCRSEYVGGLIEIAWTNAAGAANQAQMFPSTDDGIDAAAEIAIRWNRERRNLYVGVNPRKPDAFPGGRAEATDVEIAFFHFVDADTAEAEERVRRNSVLPCSFSVLTGRTPNPRPHVYWELDEPTRHLEAWTQQQRALRDHFKGDAVIDPPRIMRLAGTVNWPNEKKIARGYKTELVTLRTHYDGEERDPIPYRALAGAYPVVPPPRPLEGQRTVTPDAVATDGTKYDPATGEILEPVTVSPQASPGLNLATDRLSVDACLRAILAGQEWHNNMIRVVAHWCDRGWTDAEILAAGYSFTLAGWTHEQTRKEIVQAISGARRKYAVPNPEYEVGTPGAVRQSALNIIWWSDLHLADAGKPLIKTLLDEASMSVVYGESGSGKSFFVTDIAFHIAAGLSWRGMKTLQGGVIYIAAEGARGMRKRKIALARQHAILGAIPFGVVPCAVNLCNPKADTAELIELVKQASARVGPVLMVVVDTLARTFGGGDENSPDDMGSFIANVDKIRSAVGCHVCIVHHSGKDQAKGGRGHSSLRAATDTEIEITKTSDDIRTATVKKQKEGEDGERYLFSLKVVALGRDDEDEDITSCVVEHIEATRVEEQRVFLTEREQLAHRAIVQQMLKNESDWLWVNALRETLIGYGVVERDSHRMSGTRLKDSLVSKGKIRIENERIYLVQRAENEPENGSEYD